ncbi:MAG: apolipoprotein N-acyltransferase [Saprospiraceae bacterium]
MPNQTADVKSSNLPRISVIVLLLIICAVSGWKMLRLPLWGWWPLVMLLSFWFAVILFFFPKEPEKRKWIGAATASGILLGFGFPPSPLTWVVAFAWIPFLAVENGIFQKRDKPVPKQIFFYSFHTFIIWNIITTFWVTNTAFIAGIFANFVYALLMATTMTLIHVIGRRLALRWFYVVFISFWISFEYLQHHWDFLWPWLTLGNSLAQYPWAVQWYEFTGAFGGSLWILSLNVLGYLMIIRWLRAKPLRIGIYFSLFFIPILISFFLWFTTKPGDVKPVSVTIIQPNFEPHYEKFTIPERDQVKRFLQLSRESIDSLTSYLVFPETSFEGVQLNSPYNPSIDLFQHFIDSFPNLNLVAGITSYRILKANELDNTNYRIHINPEGDSTYWDVQNSALQLTSGQKDLQVYFKSRLVPGPEMFPFKKVLFFFKPIVVSLGGSYEGLTEQPERSVFNDGPVTVAPVICYESIFGEYCGGYVKKGATAFFIVTNDGWWDKTPGHIQHLKLGALRAIEHRRPIVRSANTGISCFIDSRGQIHQPTKYGETTFIKGEIIPETRITFYTKWGDLIAKTLVVISFVILIVFLFRFFVKRNSGSTLY